LDGFFYVAFALQNVKDAVLCSYTALGIEAFVETLFAFEKAKKRLPKA